MIPSLMAAPVEFVGILSSPTDHNRDTVTGIEFSNFSTAANN